MFERIIFISILLQLLQCCSSNQGVRKVKSKFYIFIYIIYIIYRHFFRGAPILQTTATLQQLQQIG